MSWYDDMLPARKQYELRKKWMQVKGENACKACKGVGVNLVDVSDGEDSVLKDAKVSTCPICGGRGKIV